MSSVVKTILVPTDFSTCARRAEDYAAYLAAACGADVLLLSVAEFVPGMDLDYPVNKMYVEAIQKEARAALEKAEQQRNEVRHELSDQDDSRADGFFDLCAPRGGLCRLPRGDLRGGGDALVGGGVRPGHGSRLPGQ